MAWATRTNQNQSGISQFSWKGDVSRVSVMAVEAIAVKITCLIRYVHVMDDEHESKAAIEIGGHIVREPCEE